MRLAQDWNFVTRHRRVLLLPRAPSIAQILETFAAEEGARAVAEGGAAVVPEIGEQVAAGLTACFERACGDRLLYCWEWPQHAEVVADGQALVEQYGAEHLLRLLVQLPDLVPALPARETWQLEQALQRLMGHLLERKAELFPLAAYAVVSEPYARAAEAGP